MKPKETEKMIEHLFKLKKDGKTVGYLCIKDGCISTCSDPWDTAHPFVTKDKNGNDVFEGDKMLSKDKLRKYEVAWNEKRCNWFLRGLNSAWAVDPPGNWKDYTLIEDKPND